MPLSKTRFHVGTSGYSYKEWKGAFYPKDLSAAKMLTYYGERFGTVEINGMFRRLPSAASVAAWLEQVPKDFRFVVKAPQKITHIKRLRDVKEPLGEFLKIAGVLKSQLGPLLFQLPPNFKKDVDRLKDFLSLLPAKQRVAMEFRNASWFEQDVYDVLGKRDVAMCIADTDEDLKVPFVSTADWGYVRLRSLDYRDADLKRWIKQIRGQKWSEAYVFFKHEDEGNGPRFAKRFVELASK